MNSDENDQEKFSDDPEKQLRMENEILKLKLRAELGGRMEQFDELPPELENIFINNVLEFEHKHVQSEKETVYKILGAPEFANEAGLSDNEVSEALVGIKKIMEEKNIVLEYATDYPDRVKYKFVTEELFQHETTFFHMPGMTMYFSYEEFHPNHEVEIRRKATAFIEHWFERDFSEFSTELAYELVSDDARSFTREQLLQKMQHIFNAFDRFENCRYFIGDVQFELNNETMTGLGFAEGGVKYDAVLESAETIHQEGPYKLYFQTHDHTCWDIFFFYWPGFNW